MGIRRALLSVHEKHGLADFARQLQKRGIELIAGAGTEQYLRDEGLAVTPLGSFFGAPDLAPEGSLAKSELSLHPALRTALGGGGDDDHAIDMVVVNLSPFERVANRRDKREGDVVEAIDLVGPAILRIAAARFESVVVVADPEVYPLVLEELNEDEVAYDVRKLLASRAFDCTAHYELAVANWFSETEDFPTYLLRDYVKLADLPYGENPHQRAAYYVEVGARRHLLSMVEQTQGGDLSFNNLNDLNAARGVVGEFSIPACAIVKHGAPSGVAVSGSIEGAFERALACDPLSARGGVVAINRPVNAALAQALGAHRFEVLFAPGYDADALPLLAKETGLRVLHDHERRKRSPGERDMLRVIGGLLVQDSDSTLDERDSMEVVTAVHPDEQQWGDLLFAWRVVKWAHSNAVVLASNLATVGIGGGKPSRHDGIVFALNKAADHAQGAMMASDAFFSHEDAPQTAIEAGIAGIIQPGGSQRDDEILELADAAKIPMVFTNRRHFRH